MQHISTGQYKAGNFPSPSIPTPNKIFALTIYALPFHVYCFTTKWEKYPQSAPATEKNIQVLLEEPAEEQTHFT